jgi:hypothetical protein
VAFVVDGQEAEQQLGGGLVVAPGRTGAPRREEFRVG